MKRLKRHIAFGILLLSGMLPLHAQMTIKSPQQDVAIEKGRIAITVVGKPGAKAWLYVNDVLADSGEIRIDGKYDFLNIDVPEGPVELRTEAVGAGNRIFKATRKVHVIGSPVTIIADKNTIEMPADSESVQTVKIEIQDAWGYRVGRIKTVTVSISKGHINAADLDSLSAGWQLPVVDGQAEIPVRASATVGQETISVRTGEAVLDISARYTTPLMEFMMVGSLDAAASLAETKDKNFDEPKFTLADWTYQEGQIKDIPASGRLAFYAKGSLLRKYQVTTSYDSRRTEDNQLFRDLDPNKQYALYGDASTLTYDAQTQSKFYGRIERNESFIVLGDFNTDLRATEFARYDRSFTGVYSKIHAGSQAVTGFATFNDRTMKLDEIRGEGISGYYYLDASQITTNSDKIYIETRDRYHPEEVLRSDEQVRYQDYDINYVDGTLMFKQPVASVDASGNPVYIVVSYECQSKSSKSLIGGLRYEGTVKNLRLGSTVIVEEKNPSNYYLYGADARIPVAKWLQVKGEVAQTRMPNYPADEQIGNAYSAEVELKPHKAVELKGYYRNVDEDFTNSSQTGSKFEVGAQKYGTSGSLNLGKAGKIRSEYYQQLSDEGTVNEQRTEAASANYEYSFSDKTSARVGYQDAMREKMGTDSTATSSYESKMLKGEVAHRWNSRLSTTFAHEQNLSGGETSMPSGTSIGLSYHITQQVELSLKQRLIASSERSTQTIFGIDSKVSKNSEVSGKYEIGGAAGEKLNRATIGLKNKWDVREDLSVNTAFESTATIDSLEVPTPDHSAISVGLEYLPNKPWKSSCKYELRQDQAVRKQVIILGGEVKILDGLSAITRIEDTRSKYLKTKNEVWNRGDYQLGIAYRPELSDVFNTIAKMQLIMEKNTHVAPKTRLNRLIVSTHGYWQAGRHLEFGIRFALRHILDEETGFFSSKTTSSLYALHSNYDYRRWVIGMDLRWVNLSPLGQNKTGYAGEVGYLFRKNMTIGIGYVFKQLDDVDFSYSEYTYQNFYLIFRMKFSEDIFDWR